MSPYLYGLLLVLICALLFIVRWLARKRKNTPDTLLVEALRYENNGIYDKAVTSYEAALEKIKKIRSQRLLHNKILQKLKVLRTLIEYESRTAPGKQNMPGV
ncbi:MAG TPA: hypothetical protein VHM26_06130 [Chitinophagaceae bacterium]|jgi:hypothetical protein|nr:hypothetical protein [Chitinophagaceae bacterium]